MDRQDRSGLTTRGERVHLSNTNVAQKRGVRMSFRGHAAIVGVADYKCERTYPGPRQFSLEQWADLSARALADAGIESQEVNGLVCVGDIGESAMFHPATIVEYCGWSVDFA